MLKTFFYCFFFLMQTGLFAQSDKHDLHFKYLATQWDEAIPLGNGMLGALIWQKDNRLRFSLDRAAALTLEVYDIQGRCLQRLFEGALPVGTHTATWSGRDSEGHLLPVGLYFYRLRSDGRAETRKVLLVH